jgi:hypothetical protein
MTDDFAKKVKAGAGFVPEKDLPKLTKKPKVMPKVPMTAEQKSLNTQQAIADALKELSGGKKKPSDEDKKKIDALEKQNALILAKLEKLGVEVK